MTEFNKVTIFQVFYFMAQNYKSFNISSFLFYESKIIKVLIFQVFYFMNRKL